jgi:hypothetical protein
MLNPATYTVDPSGLSARAVAVSSLAGEPSRADQTRDRVTGFGDAAAAGPTKRERDAVNRATSPNEHDAKERDRTVIAAPLGPDGG